MPTIYTIRQPITNYGGLDIREGALQVGGVNVLDRLGTKADSNRQIQAGDGLNGGGSLASDRTLSVDYDSVAQKAHNHDGDYLSLSGGSLTGSVNLNSNSFKNYLNLHRDGVSSWEVTPTTRGQNGLAVLGDSDSFGFYFGGDQEFYIGDQSNKAWHQNNFDPADKVDVSTFNSHANDSTFHQNWGDWDTDGSDALRAHGRRVIVAQNTGDGDRLVLNYGQDFANGVNILGTLKNNGNTVWHEGNMSMDSYVRSDETGASVLSNFTIAGRNWLGNSDKDGSSVYRIKGGGNRIQISANASESEQSGVQVFIKGDGSARFRDQVHVGSLATDSTDVVENLNAEMIGGYDESDFVRNASISDMTGVGTLYGLELRQKDPTPDMSVDITPGTVTTDSGMRAHFWQTENVALTGAPSTAGWERYDLVVVRGMEAGNNEGDLRIFTGSASSSASIEWDACYAENPGCIVLGAIHVESNIGTVTDGSDGSTNMIDNSIKDMANVRLVPGEQFVVQDPVFTEDERGFNENGMWLTDKYAQLAANNRFSGTQKFDDRVTIATTGSIGRDPNSDAYGLRLRDSSSTHYMMMDANEISSTLEIVMTVPEHRQVEIGRNFAFGMDGHMTAKKSATTLVIPAGDTRLTWEHGRDDGTDYAPILTPNSGARHVYWENRTSKTVDVCIDTPLGYDLYVSAWIVGY